MKNYNPLPNYPYATNQAFSISGLEANSQVDFHAMLASFDWSLDNTGLMEVDPQTGHLYGDLDYYRLTVSDGIKEVVGQIDLATRDTFQVASNLLDINKPWRIVFSASRGSTAYNTGYKLNYEVKVPYPAALTNGQNNSTVPSVDVWSNIEWTIKLDSTTDAAFKFPEEGILVKRGEAVDMNQYSTAGNLVNAADYFFKVYVQRKPELDAGLSSESISGAVIVTNPAFPFSVGVKPTELYGDLQLDSTAAGAQTATFSYQVSNGGVLNGTSFQLTFTVV